MYVIDYSFHYFWRDMVIALLVDMLDILSLCRLRHSCKYFYKLISDAPYNFSNDKLQLGYILFKNGYSDLHEHVYATRLPNGALHEPINGVLNGLIEGRAIYIFQYMQFHMIVNHINGNRLIIIRNRLYCVDFKFVLDKNGHLNLSEDIYFQEGKHKKTFMSIVHPYPILRNQPFITYLHKKAFQITIPLYESFLKYETYFIKGNRRRERFILGWGLKNEICDGLYRGNRVVDFTWKFIQGHWRIVTVQ